MRSTIIFAIFILRATLTQQRLPLPRHYSETTAISHMSFDYSSAVIDTNYWNLGTGVSSSSSGVTITPSSPNSAQGTLSSIKQTSVTNWRVNYRLDFTNYSPLTVGAYSLVSFLVHDPSAATTGSNTLTNFRGLAVTLEIKPSGTVKGFYTESTMGIFTPATNENLQACATCNLPSTLPDYVEIQVQCVNDIVTVTMQVPGVTPSICISNAEISGFANMALSTGLKVSLVSVNSYHSTVQATYLMYYNMKPVTASSVSLSSQTYWLMADQYHTSYHDDKLSFNSYSSMQYSTESAASASSTINVVKLVPGTSDGEGAIKADLPSATIGLSEFRIEIDFRVQSYSVLAPITFYFFLSEGSTVHSARLATTTGLLSNFQGLVLEVKIGTTMSYKVGFANTLGTLSLSTRMTSSCNSATANSLDAGDIVEAGSASLTIQLVEDGLTVSLMPHYSTTTASQTPLYLFSNLGASGAGAVLAAMTDPVVRIAQYNPLSTNGQIEISRVSFWADQGIAPTPETYISPESRAFIAAISPVTRFPIPELTQGSAVPVLTVDDVLNCTFTKSSVRAPNDENVTDIYLSMTVDRLLEIEDIDETISITATMYMQWGVHKCTKEDVAPDVNTIERLVTTRYTEVWHPTLIYANSSDDIYMQAASYGLDMEIIYVPTAPNRTLFFYWTQIGVFTSKCGLDLRKFPFDEQECDFTFLMKEPVDFVTFGGVYLRPPILLSGQWSLKGYSARVSSTQSTVIRNGRSSAAVFTLKFRRNASYHMTNLVAPCLVLISLVLGSFLMPPQKPDRPVICCTILLAFVVAQTDVLKEVPHTSQRILLAEYILLLTGMTAAVTMYHMIVCGLCYMSHVAHKPIQIFGKESLKMRAARGLDFALSLVSLDFFLIINIYAMSVILD